MIAYATRAVAWPRLLASTGAIVALVALVAARPGQMWPLQGLAIGVAAGTAAWSMDETAAAVVDALPRSLRWRTLARTAIVAPVAAAWVGSVLVAADRLPPHTGLFLLQGFAALLAGVAFATWRRSLGDATPGTAFAATAIPVAAMFALLRPWPDRLPLFPLWPGEAWTLSAVIWMAVALGAAALLATATRERRVKTAAQAGRRRRRMPGG